MATKNDCVDKCGKCNKIVKDDKGLCCHYCESWFHPKCENITNNMYDALNEQSNQIRWYCKTNNPEMTFVK